MCRHGMRGLRLLCGGLTIALAAVAFGQTVPNDDGPPTAHTVVLQRGDKPPLSRADSLARIKLAENSLRQGELAAASARVLGADFVLRLDGDFDPRDVDFVHGLIAYQNADLREAYSHAGSIHQVGKRGNVNLDAALLKSLVYLQAGAYPLAEKWANWVLEINPDNVGARGIQEVLATRSATGYRLLQIVESADPECEIAVWSGQEDSPQPLLFCFRKRDDFFGFRGAVALERLTPAWSAETEYVLRFYDLEGTPLLFERLGPQKPSTDAILDIIKGFDPRQGSGRYSVMRADLEARAWRRAGVLPYASMWSARALSAGAATGDPKPPLPPKNGSWKLAGKDIAYLPGSQQPVELKVFANLDLTQSSAWRDEHGPLDHSHVAVLSAAGQYLASFTLDSSEPVPDERVYFLNFLIGGVSRLVKRYDDLAPPGRQQIEDDIRWALQHSQATPTDGTVQARLIEYAVAKKAYRDSQNPVAHSPRDQLASLKKRLDDAARSLSEITHDAQAATISQQVLDILKPSTAPMSDIGVVDGAAISPQFVQATLERVGARSKQRRLDEERRVARQRELAAGRRAASQAAFDRRTEYEVLQDEQSHGGL